MIRRPPRSTLSSSSAASDVYKRQYQRRVRGCIARRMPAPHHGLGKSQAQCSWLGTLPAPRSPKPQGPSKSPWVYARTMPWVPPKSNFITQFVHEPLCSNYAAGNQPMEHLCTGYSTVERSDTSASVIRELRLLGGGTTRFGQRHSHRSKGPRTAARQLDCKQKAGLVDRACRREMDSLRTLQPVVAPVDFSQTMVEKHFKHLCRVYGPPAGQSEQRPDTAPGHLTMRNVQVNGMAGWEQTAVTGRSFR
eukprot:TRINITY_DN9208_c0_g1_i3.p1 TRINITY_DN9208_c0_g1~~TRINITY_DN9208_c0_g1_i3.p1  ORF type:complete len:249 (+),score=12.40 TRINITY_DN9208_c0_g1_i3:91-837(+)